MLNHLKKLYIEAVTSPVQKDRVSVDDAYYAARFTSARFMATIMPLMPGILAWWEARNKAEFRVYEEGDDRWEHEQYAYEALCAKADAAFAEAMRTVFPGMKAADPTTALDSAPSDN